MLMHSIIPPPHHPYPKQINQVDVNPKKFEMAVQLGATDCLNPKDFPDKPIQQARVLVLLF